jgi:hypothetical protein
VKSVLRSLNRLIDSAVRKIFNVADDLNVQLIRRMTGLFDVTTIYEKQLCKFLLKFINKSSNVSQVFYHLVLEDVRSLIEDYCPGCELTLPQQLRAVLNVLTVCVSV